eukprot:jgi/Mesen1/7690/ME000405S06980
MTLSGPASQGEGFFTASNVGAIWQQQLRLPGAWPEDCRAVASEGAMVGLQHSPPPQFRGVSGRGADRRTSVGVKSIGVKEHASQLPC